MMVKQEESVRNQLDALRKYSLSRKGEMPSVQLFMLNVLLDLVDKVELKNKKPARIRPRPPEHFISLQTFYKEQNMTQRTPVKHLQDFNLINDPRYYVKLKGIKRKNWVCRERLLHHMSLNASIKIRNHAQRLIDHYKKIGTWKDFLIDEIS